MHTLGYIGLGSRTILYSMLSDKAKERIQQKRLRKLVRYAKANSPFYAKYYKDVNVDGDFKQTDLPPVTKKMMMDNFNDFVTDRAVKRDEVTQFTRNPDNLNKRYLGKYMVAQTSGSTGTPAWILHNRTHENINSVLVFMHVPKMRLPVALVSMNGTFAQETGNIQQNLKKMPFLKKYVRIIEASQDPNNLIRELNEFKPKVISGYPGNLALLFNQPNVTEKLTFKPDVILLGGEFLTASTRNTIEQGFGCRVCNIYMSTETTPFAFECEHHHLHLHNEWTLLEAVDENNKPVAPGELSAKILVTNLADYAQPRIRYEMTDRVRIHTETCPCGKKGKWLEVEGRVSDIIYFTHEGKQIGVPPMFLHDVFEYTPGVSWFQGILHGGKHFEIRLSVLKGYDRDKIYAEVEKNMYRDMKKVYGIEDFDVYLSDVLPEINHKTRKFKQFYSVDD